MKRQRKQVRGQKKYIEKRLAVAAKGRAVVASTLDLDAWLRAL